MRPWPVQLALSFGLLTCISTAQVLNFPTTPSTAAGMGPLQGAQMDFNLLTLNSQASDSTPLENPSESRSKLDLKAPGKARREYAKGYQLLIRKDWQAAIEHLTNSTGIYPQFVAAHNALGSAYLGLERNEDARREFAQAVALDDHLPNSFLNLGCAQLALKQYPEAEESLKKASSIAPLDLQLAKALAYGEFLNHDYPAVFETVRQTHSRKHDNAAVVHFFAAAAWQAQDNLSQAQHEMEILLLEDPKSPSVDHFRNILEQLKAEQVSKAEAELRPAALLSFSYGTSAPGPTSQQVSQQAQKVFQDLREKKQIAEAEASPGCTNCTADDAELVASSSSASIVKPPATRLGAAVFRAAVDEVSIFFSATDHGKPVTDLLSSEVLVRDDDLPPQSIHEFRNASNLPLRLGLIIDTSDSVSDRFSFEQAAAIRFLQSVVTDKEDLAFILAVNNSVLLVQDFTADQALISHAINQLATGGGTSLWDAVSFACEKLADHPEAQPVARVLVLISDGEDNSSSTVLKQAIAKAVAGEVAVYTVSTRDGSQEPSDSQVGDHALRTLSDLTGGTALTPRGVGDLNGSLADLQKVIRSRYFISYKPDHFHRNGQYRTIDIQAERNGRPLKVYARKGYYASER